MPLKHMTSGLLSFFMLTVSSSAFGAQAPTDGMDINALKARYADEKTKLSADKGKYDQLKKELDDLKNKIKLQEENLKLVEKRIKNDEKLSQMKK